MLDRTKAPAVSAPGDLTLPLGVFDTLPNGCRLHIISGGTQPVCQMSITFSGGKCEFTNPAVPDLAAKLMLEGAADLSGEEIAEALDFNGAMARFAVHDHHTTLVVTFLNSRADAVLPLILKVLTAPTFPERATDVYRERSIALLRQSNAKVSHVSHQALIPFLFGRENPAAREIVEEDYRIISRADLLAFSSRVFTARSCHCIIAGQTTPEIIAALRALLLALPDGAPVVPDIVPFEPMEPGWVSTTVPGAGQQSSISLGIPAPHRSHPDYVPLRATVVALGGYFGSRLMSNIREEKGLTYGIDAALCGHTEGSYVLISAQTDPANIDTVVTEVKNELRGLVDNPPQGEELRRLLITLQSMLLATLDTPFAIADYYRTKNICDIPDTYFADQTDTARSITPDTISRLAALYLDPSHLRISIAG